MNNHYRKIRPAMTRPKIRIPNPQMARLKGGTGRVQRNRGRMSIQPVRNIKSSQNPPSIMPRIKKAGCLKVAINRLNNLEVGDPKEYGKGLELLLRLFPKQGNNRDKR